ncbi:MAG: NAD(P)H-dependent oxidoreductase [Bdellovibrionota bacterium]
MNILVVQSHPYQKSFCAALAIRYTESALKLGHQVEFMQIADMKFDPILRYGYRQETQSLEKDLINFQNKITWADHIVWVYPNWWGGLPALLKGLIDRSFLPGFAFKYTNGLLPIKLLTGKTSDIIMTLDTPIFFYKFFMGAPGLKIMKSAILGFCGIKVNNAFLCAPIRNSTEEKREIWLKKASQLAKKLSVAGKP